MKNFKIAVVITTLLTFNQASAQINYQKVNDTLVTSKQRFVCLDSAAKANASTSAGTIKFRNDNGMLAEAIDTEVEFRMNLSPLALNANEVIDATGKWANPTFPPSGSYSCLYINGFGEWKNVTDKYLAVRIKRSGKWHYGWVRMDVISNGQMGIIKDYACNMQAEKPIKAGQQSNTSIGELALAEVNIAGDERSVTFANMQGFKRAAVTVVNTSGTIIKTAELDHSYTMSTDFEPGIYMINLNVDGHQKMFKWYQR